MPESPPEEYVYECRNVHYTFRAHHDPVGTLVLKGLNCRIRRYSSFAIIGPSGSGKSTLLRLLSGLSPPDEGHVLFRGVDLAAAGRKQMSHLRRRIGMTFQRGGLFDSMTCAENLRLPLREAWGASGQNLKDRVDKALAEVRLHEVHDLMVHEISGGMQKRLGIARALILEPEVVLFDDPTAGLDPVTSSQIINLILEVKRRYQMTIITVTADVARAYQIADEVGFLAEGKFIQTGSVKEIQSSTVPMVYGFIRGLPEEGESL